MLRPNLTPTPDAFIEMVTGDAGPAAFFLQLANSTAIGRLVQFRDRIYCGNGVDPLKSWKTDGTAVQTYGTLTDLGVPPAPTHVPVDPASSATRLLSGTYQYCWGVFDTATGLYTGRSKAAEVIVGANETLTFAGLSGVAAYTVQRLFIAPRGFPIEWATMQGSQEMSGFPVVPVIPVSVIDVTEIRVPVIGVQRTGNMFVVWRNRVVFSGQASDPYSVFATDIILPGLEQASFNQGTLFPLAAKVPLPAPCTGVGIAGVTSDFDASSPLLFFTVNRTFIATGDPFDPEDTTATLTQLSGRVGCIGHDSIANTPLGTIFCGLDSVYLIPVGGGFPQDIGWPIGETIRLIGPGTRHQIVATYHRGFYKLAIPISGGSTNQTQWWLDLRQGVGETPSWWGPHSGLTVTAVATDPANTNEIERGYAALHGGNQITLIHQNGLFSDLGVPVVSRLHSGRFDANEPFLVKIITRLRIITQSAGPGEITVRLITDGGTNWLVPPIQLSFLPEEQGGQWQDSRLAIPRPTAPNRQWRTARWRSLSPVEAQTIMPYTRPRGLSVEAILEHATAQRVELRDFEILAIFSERKVRYTASPQGRFPAERVSK